MESFRVSIPQPQLTLNMHMEGANVKKKSISPSFQGARSYEAVAFGGSSCVVLLPLLRVVEYGRGRTTQHLLQRRFSRSHETSPLLSIAHCTPSGRRERQHVFPPRMSMQTRTDSLRIASIRRAEMARCNRRRLGEKPLHHSTY